MTHAGVAVAVLSAISIVGLAPMANASTVDLINKYKSAGLPESAAIKLVSDANGAQVSVESDISVEGLDLHTASVGPERTPMYISANTTVEVSSAEEIDEQELGISYNATPGAVRLVWNSIPGVTEYEVYRDGSLVGKSPTADYLDTEVTPAATYEYQVGGARLLTPEAVTDPETEVVTYPNREVGFTGATEVYVPPIRIKDKNGWDIPRKPFPSGPGEPMKTMDLPPGGGPTTTFAYRSFIKDDYVPSRPCVVWPLNAKYFAGDNRDFSATSLAFRTSMRVTALWNSRQLSHSKYVNESNLLSITHKVLETRRATDENMKFKQLSMTTSKARFQLDHSATDPFCPRIGGAVRYKATVTMYKNHSWSISGWTRPAPHQEAYIQQNNGSWKTVIKRKNRGLHCLTGVCGTIRIDANS